MTETTDLLILGVLINLRLVDIEERYEREGEKSVLSITNLTKVLAKGINDVDLLVNIIYIDYISGI